MNQVRDWLMTDHGLTRDQAQGIIDRSELAYPKYHEGGWNDREIAEKVLQRLSAWRQGQKVRCLDATNGSNFLEAGKVYIVDQAQLGWSADTLLFLCGMAKGWEVARFERVGE